MPSSSARWVKAALVGYGHGSFYLTAIHLLRLHWNQGCSYIINTLWYLIWAGRIGKDGRDGNLFLDLVDLSAKARPAPTILLHAIARYYTSIFILI